MNPDPKPKTIRLKGKDRTNFRKKVAYRAVEHCQECSVYAPLLWDGVFDVFSCGHVAHIKGYGAGGGDEMHNVKWKCYRCHILKEHGLKWGSNTP